MVKTAEGIQGQTYIGLATGGVPSATFRTIYSTSASSPQALCHCSNPPTKDTQQTFTNQPPTFSYPAHIPPYSAPLLQQLYPHTASPWPSHYDQQLNHGSFSVRPVLSPASGNQQPYSSVPQPPKANGRHQLSSSNDPTPCTFYPPIAPKPGQLESDPTQGSPIIRGRRGRPSQRPRGCTSWAYPNILRCIFEALCRKRHSTSPSSLSFF